MAPDRRLKESRPESPCCLTRVIDRALSPLPSDRFEDAEAMACALDPTITGPGRLLKRWPSLAVWLQPFPRSRRRHLAWLDGPSIGTAVPFAARDWVLVTGSDNRTGEPLLDRTLEGASNGSSSASSYVNVVPRERVNDALLQMRKPVDTRVDGALGRDVARRDGAMRALLGGASR